jgi:hypothetical protein
MGQGHHPAVLKEESGLRMNLVSWSALFPIMEDGAEIRIDLNFTVAADEGTPGVSCSVWLKDSNQTTSELLREALSHASEFLKL